MNALPLYGTDEPVPDTLVLSAGALRCALEGGQVRGLWWHDTEVLRGVAYLLRDRQWGTAPARIEALQVQQAPAGFSLQFLQHMLLEGATLTGRVRIEGRGDGHFSFVVEAVPDQALTSCRCGLVVLHPADCAGSSLHVVHTDGRTEDTRFPEQISPGQPVFDIGSLQWSPAPGLRAHCQLAAELPSPLPGRFEMEDQRNWSDASFKTYVGSLLDPWPYRVDTGVTLRQSLALQIEEMRPDRPMPRQVAARPTSMQARWQPVQGCSMPPLGVGMPHLPGPPSLAERAAVAALRPGWLVVQADLRRHDLVAHLHQARTLAEEAGAAVQLDLLCGDELPPEESALLAEAECRSAGLAPQAVRLCPQAYLKSYQPTDRWPELPLLEAFASAARRAFPAARIGGGMLTYFTELNRCRQSAAGIDFIGHSTCPIVHAADDVSVMQTLQALPHIARTVRQVWPALGWRVGPVSLSAARNPYGQRTVPNPLGLRLPLAERDPRHSARFGAAWYAGYVATLAPCKPELIALMDSHGPAGPLAAGPVPSPVPAWGGLTELARWAGLPLWQGMDLPPGLLGLAVSGPDGLPARAMLVNTTARAIEARLTRPMWATTGEGSHATAEAGARVEPFGVAWLTAVAG